MKGIIGEFFLFVLFFQDVFSKVIRESCYTDAEFSVYHPDIYLPNSVVQITKDVDVFHCTAKCFLHNLCQSINFWNETCTLFRHDLKSTGAEVEKKILIGSIYVETNDDRKEVNCFSMRTSHQPIF